MKAMMCGRRCRQLWAVYLPFKACIIRQWKLMVGVALLASCLVVPGIVMLHYKARSEQAQQLGEVLTFAEASVSSVGQAVRAALDSLLLGGPAVARTPSPQGIMDIPDARLDDWFSLAPVNSVLTLTMWYSGHLVRVHPPLPAAAMARLQQRNTLVVAPGDESAPPNVLSVHAYMRANTLWGMATGNVVVAGSNYVVPGSTIENLVLLTMPVFVNASSAKETWGWPESMTAQGCITGELPCYNQVTGKKWWGQLNIALGRQGLSSISEMQRLRDSGYGYKLSILQDTPGLDTPASQGPTLLFSNLDQVACVSSVLASTSTLAFEGLALRLEMCVVEGWDVAWEIPLYVTVVVLSLAIALLGGLLVVKWMRHSDLVTSLLSDTAIKHLTKHLPPAGVRKSLDESLAGSPLEKLATILPMLVEGKLPPMADVLLIIAALRNQINLHLPGNLEQYVQRAAGMDGEVAAALMAALVPEGAAGAQTAIAPSHATSGTLPVAGSALSGPLWMDNSTEQGYSDLLAALSTITGLKHAPSGAAAYDPLRSLDDLLMSTAEGRETKSPLIHQSPRSLLFSEVQDEDVLGSTFTINCSQPNAPLLTQLELILTGTWSLNGDFDVWQLTDASNGHPLSALGYWCFHQSGLIKDLQLPTRKLARFLHAIEAGYRPNPYHSKFHAAAVLQCVYALLHTGGLRGKYADSLHTVACFLAAITHDFDHQGVSNDYLIATRNELAFRYNDRSPHENHHASAGLTLLNKADNNFLEHLSVAEWSKIRKLVIELVLSTDMKQHFAINSLFSSTHRLATPNLVKRIIDKAKAAMQPSTHMAVADGDRRSVGDSLSITLADNIKTTRDDPPSASAPAHTMSSPLSVSTASRSHNGGMDAAALSGANALLPPVDAQTCTGTSSDQVASGPASGPGSGPTSGPAPVDEVDRLLALQMMLKCADLGHLSTALPIHLKWVAALEEEMFRQGDQERTLGLPISPLCDRTQTGLTKSQIGFFEVVVLPLLTNFTTRFPGTHQILNIAIGNYQHWHKQAHRGEQ